MTEHNLKKTPHQKRKHIYVETAALDYPLTKTILSRLHNLKIIKTENFKRVFNRPRQSYILQKRDPDFILAVKKAPFLYPFSDNCQLETELDGIYTTSASGCIYNCQYCFLQGMYTSGNIVIFVNTNEIFDSIKNIISNRTSHSKLMVSISYESDLLAIEHITGICKEWIDFARKTNNIIIECRTRSAAFNSIEHIKPASNFILAWSLSPQTIISQYEKKTPSLFHRLNSAADAIDAGWPVRLCFDPVIKQPDLQKTYSEFLKTVFTKLPAHKINDVTVGPFRMNKDHLKRAKKQNPHCDLFYGSQQINNKELDNKIIVQLQQYINKEKIIKWM